MTTTTVRYRCPVCYRQDLKPTAWYGVPRHQDKAGHHCEMSNQSYELMELMEALL